MRAGSTEHRGPPTESMRKPSAKRCIPVGIPGSLAYFNDVMRAADIPGYRIPDVDGNVVGTERKPRVSNDVCGREAC